MIANPSHGRQRQASNINMPSTLRDPGRKRLEEPPHGSYNTELNVVEISLDLQVLVHICPAHAPCLDHPALDRPRVIGPAIHTVFAHLFRAKHTRKRHVQTEFEPFCFTDNALAFRIDPSLKHCRSCSLSPLKQRTPSRMLSGDMVEWETAIAVRQWDCQDEFTWCFAPQTTRTDKSSTRYASRHCYSLARTSYHHFSTTAYCIPYGVIPCHTVMRHPYNFSRLPLPRW